MDESEILTVRRHLDEYADVADGFAAGPGAENDYVSFLHVRIRAFDCSAVLCLVPGCIRKRVSQLAVNIAGKTGAVEGLGAAGSVPVRGTDMTVGLVNEQVGDLRGAERDAVGGRVPGRDGALRAAHHRREYGNDQYLEFLRLHSR